MNCQFGGSKKKLCKNDDCGICEEYSFHNHEKAKFWDFESNEIRPRDVFKCSNNKFFFICGECNHKIYISLYDIQSKGRWCSYCTKKKLCDDDKCMRCKNNSFDSVDKSKFWDYEKNGDVKPRDIFRTVKYKYFFNCEDCKHSFELSPQFIAMKVWCPYCNNFKLCDDSNCDICRSRSFESHEKSKFWHIELNNGIKPRQVWKTSFSKYFFKCEDCNHIFDRNLGGIIYYNQWCRYCTNQVLCNDNNCKTCIDKTFKNNKYAKFWDYEKNGDAKPEKVFRSSRHKYWFICENDHSFYTALNYIADGTWCPSCNHKTEGKLLAILKTIYPNVISNYIVEWAKNDKTHRNLPFDFCIEEYKIIIELDGDQHFRQISNWSPPEEYRARDIYKMKKAFENGYSVIRLLQDDVYSDKNNWKNKLIEVIKKYDKPQPIFICNDDRYKVYGF